MKIWDKKRNYQCITIIKLALNVATVLYSNKHKVFIFHILCEQIGFIDYKSKIIYPEMIEGVKPLNEKIYKTKEGKLIIRNDIETKYPNYLIIINPKSRQIESIIEHSFFDNALFFPKRNFFYLGDDDKSFNIGYSSNGILSFDKASLVVNHLLLNNSFEDVYTIDKGLIVSTCRQNLLLWTIE